MPPVAAPERPPAPSAHGPEASTYPHKRENAKIRRKKAAAREERLQQRARRDADPDPEATAVRQRLEKQRAVFFLCIGMCLCCLLPENFRQHFRSERPDVQFVARVSLGVFALLSLGWAGAAATAAVFDAGGAVDTATLEVATCSDQVSSCHDCTRSVLARELGSPPAVVACVWLVPEGSRSASMDGGVCEPSCVVEANMSLCVKPSRTGKKQYEEGDCVPERPVGLLTVVGAFTAVTALGLLTSVVACLAMLTQRVERASDLAFGQGR
jgi:hypothetical protein